MHLTDGRVAPATIVGADDITDLAVLKIDLPNLIAAEWGDSDELQVGDLVWALGSPFGLERSFTFGIVSAKSRRSGSLAARNLYQEYLQTDAAVNPGNSRRTADQHRRQGHRHQRGDFWPVVPRHQLRHSQQRGQGAVRRAARPRVGSSGPISASGRSQCRKIFRSSLGLAIGEGVLRRSRRARGTGRSGRHSRRRRDPQVERFRGHRSDALEPGDRRDESRLDGQGAAGRASNHTKAKTESKRSELELSVEVERHPDSNPTTAKHVDE